MFSNHVSAVLGPTLGIPVIPSVESPISTCFHKKRRDSVSSTVANSALP